MKERKKERKSACECCGRGAVVLHAYTLCPQVYASVPFCGGVAACRVAEYCSASPFPKGTTHRRPSAWTNPLSVAHAGSRAACSHPVRLEHLGRTVDVVSGVHVRPGQRCSETPPGGTAPGDTPWLQTASALRALKSQRAVLPPMASTGFGYLCGQGTSLTMSTCRTSVSLLPFLLKVATEYFSWLSDFKQIPPPLPRVLLLSGMDLGYFPFHQGLTYQYAVPACEVHVENRKTPKWAALRSCRAHSVMMDPSETREPRSRRRCRVNSEMVNPVETQKPPFQGELPRP